MQLHSLPGTDKEQRTYERQKQHTGILLLNVPWQFPLIYYICKKGLDWLSLFSFNNFCIKAMVNSKYNCNKRKGNTSLYEIWLTVMKEIVTMTTIGLYEMSSPSSSFFGVRSKFLDVSLFRPNLFIKDDSRTRGCHSTIKPAKKSFVIVIFHHSISNFSHYLSSIVIHSTVNIIWEVR